MGNFSVVTGTSQELPPSQRAGAPRPYRNARVIPKGVSPMTLALTGAQELLLAQGVKVDIPALPEADVKIIAMNRGRSLVSPGQFPDKELRRYLTLLAPLALSPSKASAYADVSPRLVPLLLGGMDFLALEELTERTLSMMEVEEEDVEPTLTFAMRLIGFGAEQRHIHTDCMDTRLLACLPGEEEDMHLARIASYEPPPEPRSAMEVRYGQTPAHLRSTRGAFAETLPQLELYPFELQRKVLRHKWQIMSNTVRLFSPYSEVIPEAARRAIRPSGAKWMDDTQVTAQGFAEAVRWVFEKPWHELDLRGDLPLDVTKVMARQLIACIGRNNKGSAKEPGRISARALLGMSLLTGIPTPKFVRFAVAEQARRGETFLTGEAIRRVVQMVDESELFQYASSGWMDEMNLLALKMETQTHPVREYFAFRLRQGNAPLTSTQGVYQIVDFDDDENPKFKPRIDPRLMGLHEEI